MVDEFFDSSGKNNLKIKRAIIAGAAEALKQKSKDAKKSDSEILQDITKEIHKIIMNLD